MRHAICRVLIASAVFVVSSGCGGGGTSAAKKAMTPEEVQVAREKDAQEMLKMNEKRNAAQNSAKNQNSGKK